MAFSLLVTFGSAMALCATIRVPADYPTIQGAIDAADAGDAIEISAGLYRESILIDKSIEISGAGSTRTFIQGDPGAPIADITVGTVLFEKLCVGRPGEQTPGVRRDLTGQDHIGNAGVVLRSSCFALFRSCAVQSNSYGILVLDYARLVMSRCSVSAIAAKIWSAT